MNNITRINELIKPLREFCVSDALGDGDFSLLDTAADVLENIFYALVSEARCPCCYEDAECLDGCTYVFDAPDAYELMVSARNLLIMP